MKILNISRISKIFLVCCFLFLIFNIPAIGDDDVKFQYKETKDLMKVVESACKMIEIYGEKVFPEFRKKGSAWFNDNNYVFVDDMSGTEIVNPAFPDMEGKNIIDLQDKWGKYVVKDYLREVYKYGKNKKSGWFHYIWPNPKNGKLAWKSIYVMSAVSPTTKTEYVVGSGLYNLRMERAFMIEAVEDAAQTILKKGLKKGCDVIKSKAEEFFYKNTYVFVSNARAEELANPIFPEIDADNIWMIQDMERNYVYKEFLKIAKSKEGSGWFVSVWEPEHKNDIPKYKITYIKSITIDNELLVLGTSAPLQDF
jgi:signal transduction histidine kinase